MTTRGALFLDRDGVIVEDIHELVRPEQLRVIDGAPEAIVQARARGRAVVVVTNQPVVARGLLGEDALQAIHAALGAMLATCGAHIDRFYYCPHHPRATLDCYRVVCACRKPRPGMLEQAARDLGIDLGGSVMIGDRISDVAAGARAGCKTVLVESGMHLAPPIESPDGPIAATPDFTCRDLRSAVAWVLRAAE